MIWEHILPALIAAIPGIVAFVYGTMRWEFNRNVFLKLVPTILFITVLIYVTVTWGLTGRDLLALLAAIPGIAALWLGMRDRRKSYLQIALRVDLNENRFLSAMAEVENRNISYKELSNALLLVGPEHEDPIGTMRQLGITVYSTNDIAAYDEADTVSGPAGRALIRLPFFYSENVDIADEKVSYRAPINTRDIPRGVPYSIRFFIDTPERLHRTTHDSFVLPPSCSVNWI